MREQTHLPRGRPISAAPSTFSAFYREVGENHRLPLTPCHARARAHYHHLSEGISSVACQCPESRTGHSTWRHLTGGPILSCAPVSGSRVRPQHMATLSRRVNPSPRAWAGKHRQGGPAHAWGRHRHPRRPGGPLSSAGRHPTTNSRSAIPGPRHLSQAPQAFPAPSPAENFFQQPSPL